MTYFPFDCQCFAARLDIFVFYESKNENNVFLLHELNEIVCERCANVSTTGTLYCCAWAWACVYMIYILLLLCDTCTHDKTFDSSLVPFVYYDVCVCMIVPFVLIFFIVFSLFAQCTLRVLSVSLTLRCCCALFVVLPESNSLYLLYMLACYCYHYYIARFQRFVKL